MSEAKPRWTLYSSLRVLPYLLFKNLLFHSATIPHRKIQCHSLIEFDRLRPFPVNHSLLAIIFPCFVACSSSIEFVTVRSSSNPNIPFRRAGEDIPQINFVFSTYYSHITTLCRCGPLPDSSFFPSCPSLPSVQKSSLPFCHHPVRQNSVSQFD